MLRKANNVLTLLRTAIDDNISLQLAQAFLVVAMHEGEGVAGLAERAGTNKSTMSRYLLDLSDHLRTGATGYGLLIRTNDPNNLRMVMYTLTNRGKLLRNSVVEAMGN